MAIGRLGDPPTQPHSSNCLDSYDEKRLIPTTENESNNIKDAICGHLGAKVKSENNDNSYKDSKVYDKRSHPDDEDVNEQEGGGKRQEGNGNISRKLGRKLTTSEPTTKRKAQNRAAQRAFRERKEKYLKDLEMKVEDLEKKSKSANQENSVLRAQLEKMSSELQEYRKKFSLARNSNDLSTTVDGLKSYNYHNPHEFNFYFNFPKFGYPQESIDMAMNNTRNTSIPQLNTIYQNQTNPQDQTIQFPETKNMQGSMVQGQSLVNRTELSGVPDIYSAQIPQEEDGYTLYEKSSIEEKNLRINMKNLNKSGSKSDFSSSNIAADYSIPFSSPTTSSTDQNDIFSPSLKATENPGSQNNASDLAFTTIGEKNSCTTTKRVVAYQPDQSINRGDDIYSIPDPNRDQNNETDAHKLEFSPFYTNGIDWLAEKNGNQFNPHLTDEYHKPLGKALLADNKFNEYVFDGNYSAPVFDNTFNIVQNKVSAENCVGNSFDDKKVEGNKTESEGIWEFVPSVSVVKEGNLDLDSLCSELRNKARCSELSRKLEHSDLTNCLMMYAERNAKNKTEFHSFQ